MSTLMNTRNAVWAPRRIRRGGAVLPDIQADPRIDNPECRHLDRVVFHLGYDDDIKLGDSGVLNVMISRDALAKRDFQSAYLTWDCS